MGNSTGTRDLHVDRILSNVALGYAMANGIAGQIAPIVPVVKQTDLYDVYSRADALRTEDSRRAPWAEARKVTRSVSSDSYRAENYALKYPVTIEDKSNMDPNRIQHLYNGRAKYVTDKLLLGWEARVAALVTNTSNVGSSSAVSTEWSAGNADVIGDVNGQLDNVQDTTGKRANTLVFGLDAWRSCRRSTDLRNLVFGSNNGGGWPNARQIADVFEVDRILVGATFQNTANEAQAESLEKIWADYVLAAYVSPNASTENPSFMYSFLFEPEGLPAWQVERHPYDSKTKTEEIEVGYYQDEKITGTEYGALLVAVNSST